MLFRQTRRLLYTDTVVIMLIINKRALFLGLFEFGVIKVILQLL
jgi:hypothetical protein